MSAFEYGIRAARNEPLTIDQLRRSVPALFAEAPHQSRSDRYVFISTYEVMQRLMSEGFQPVEARLQRTRDAERRSHAKHMIRFRSETQIARTLGDTSFEITLRNGHDGTAAYDFMAGLFRLVCLNGMTVSDGTVANVHVRHSGNRQKQLEQVVEGAFTVLQQAPVVLEAPRKWSQIELTRDEQMVFADAARTIRFGDSEGEVRTPITADQLLHPRRPADAGNDLWRTFNRIQENTTRGGLTAYDRNANRLRRVTTREVRGIDGDIKLNKALWQLADKMAELKA